MVEVKTHRKKRSTQAPRPTIGFLTGNLWTRMTSYPTVIWAGVADAARERDANLICFAAWSLGAISLDEFGTQRNVLFDLVTSDSVDGLVISSGMLGMFVSAEELQDFCDRYRPLPMVSIALALEGIPSVLVDNATGLRDAVSHLIEVHGYRRIAFIRGPEGHAEADVRYRAYAEALAKHGLALNPDLVASGDFLSSSGAAAMRLLLDERKLRPGVDFEAVMAASDAMALGALEVLQAQGTQVPYDVAMVGFDDVAEAGVSTPSLTTVRQPIHEQGKRAVEVLLALLAGEDVPERVTLPTEMVVRRSCGCYSQTVLQAAAEPVVRTKASRGRSADKTLEKALATRRDEIVGAMAQAVAGHAGEAAPAPIAEWAGQVLDGFAAAMGDGSPEGFLSTLDQVLRQVATASGDLTDSAQSVSAWQGALSALRSLVLPWLADNEALSRAENIWQQARSFIAEAAQQAQRHQELQTEQQTGLLQEIGQVMITTFEMEDLMDVLARELPGLGIPSAYLSLYEGQGMPPQECRLILAYDEAGGAYPGGRVELAAGGQRFASCQLVPEGLLPQDRCYQLIVESLYFRRDQIGFALFEFEKGTQQTGLISEALRGQLSSALHGARLVQQTQDHAVRLQTAAEVSRAASSILDPDKLIQEVVKLAQERFDLYYAGLFMADEAGSEGEPGKWAVLRAGTGEAGQRMLEQGHKLEIGGESMIGWCMANRQARIALDVGEEAVRFDNPLLPETRSELALPLISRGEAIGALTIQSAEEAAFSDEDIAVLQTMGDQLANAIVNARLFEEEQRARFLLDDRIRELDCLNEIGRQIDASPPIPEILQWVTERIPLAMRYSDDCVATVEFEGQVYGTPEAANLPRQMVGGLRVGDERVGQVTIAYTEEHDFLDEESMLLGDIVRRVSGYIESRRLFEQTQAALSEVEATYRRYLQRAWAEYLQTAETTSYETERPGVAPLGDAVSLEVQQAMERRSATILTGDGSEGKGHSALVAPIALRGQVIGALGIHDEDGARQWTDEEIALVEAIAERAALAAENLRLLDETQRHAARERLTREITDRMRRAASIEDIVQVAVDELFGVLGTSRVFVRLGPTPSAEDGGEEGTP